jgi:hypothetical protein
MLLAIAIPIGLTLGGATWALVRGPGGGGGLLLCMVFATIGAFIGGLAGQAIIENSTSTAIGVGAAVGGLLVAVVEAVVFGPRPKHVAHAERTGVVAVTHPDTGEAVKTVR